MMEKLLMNKDGSNSLNWKMEKNWVY